MAVRVTKEYVPSYQGHHPKPKQDGQTPIAMLAEPTPNGKEASHNSHGKEGDFQRVGGDELKAIGRNQAHSQSGQYTVNGAKGACGTADLIPVHHAARFHPLIMTE